MITSEYDNIFSRFLVRITDYGFAAQDEYLASQMMQNWLHATLSKPVVRKLFSSIKADDDIEEIEYEMMESLDEDSDIEFVEEMLATGMCVQWLSPQYNSVLNTSQIFTNSEQKFYSQAAHLNELRDMYTKAQTDFRKLIRDRAYALAVVNGVQS